MPQPGATRRIPATGINLFQLIYRLRDDYIRRTGQEPLNLSLGNPDTIPPPAIRERMAAFGARSDYAFHTYGEDNNLNGFAEGMVRSHGGLGLTGQAHLKALPIAGIKTASAILPLACALHRRRDTFTVVTNAPAYDIVDRWTSEYLGARRITWPLISADNMTLRLERLEEALARAGQPEVDVIFTIRPGNPAAVGAEEADWRALIEYCIPRRIRLINDGAYATLATGGHVPLARIAAQYRELEWLELYSVSKSFSHPGARLGVLVGSVDFVDDFNMIKGNTDSGPVPWVMAAYGDLFRDESLTQSILGDFRKLYADRLAWLVPALEAAGLRPACRTTAGFFTLWRVPRRVLGQEVAAVAREQGIPVHEAFNRLVIAETGIVGVHFRGPAAPDKGDRRNAGGPGDPSDDGEPLVRYAACTDVLAPPFQARLQRELERLRPEY